MRKFASRGLVLEQFKEPAILSPIDTFYGVKTVFSPVSEDICVSANQKLSWGDLLSRGIRPDSIDAFSSVDGTSVAVGEFEFEKFEGRKFLQIDVDKSFNGPDLTQIDGCEISDEDIIFGAKKCGVLNTTDKRTLEEIVDEYPNGVKNLVIDAVDDEPYVSSKLALLIYRAKYVAPAIKAINRIFGAQEIKILIYSRDDVSIRIPHKVGKYPVETINHPYPVSRRMKSDSETVYIDIGALLSFYFSAALKKPWTNTVISVAGDCIKKPCNIEVPIGTTVGDILNYCGLKKKPEMIVLGGSMTGYIVEGTDIPVLKSTKAILAFENEPQYETTTCIGCGRCIDVCPEKLLPYYIYSYYLDNNIEKLYRLSADKCTECGCCSYICPAKIDLRQYVKMSRRTLLKEMWQNEQDGQNNQSSVSEA